MDYSSPKEKNNTVNSVQSFKLIEGIFEPSEAADVLFTILDDKIRFHNIQILSIQERFNGDTRNSQRRLNDLKESKKKIANLIIDARAKGFEIEINSNIEMIFKKADQYS
jgi:hypothetical protein